MSRPAKRKPFFKMETALRTPQDFRREIELVVVALNRLATEAGLTQASEDADYQAYGGTPEPSDGDGPILSVPEATPTWTPQAIKRYSFFLSHIYG